MNEETIAHNLADIRRRLERSAAKAGRDPADVRLMAVGKTQPLDALLALYKQGQRLFGENYVQELLAKRDELPDDIEWHHIGRLQSNKARQLVGRVAMIQAVDRAELARELSKRATQTKLVQECLIEVNIGAETSKGGVGREEALALAKTVLELPGLSLAGLMSLPPYLPDPEAQRPYHRALAELARYLRDETGAPLPILSMGMSHDFEVAVEEGATLVRVGSALFGPRPARP